LEANGAASVKYRSKELIATMHRLDDKLKLLDMELASSNNEDSKVQLHSEIRSREQVLLPVYEQISVQFCELHDTPGRMKAVGVIEKEVEWETARSFFYWRLRRKLAEFDLRKQLIDAAQVGRGVKALTPLQATAVIKKWFMESPNMTEDSWHDDKVVLTWMAGNYGELEKRILGYTKEVVMQEVLQVMTAGGNTARVGISGILEGASRALDRMSAEEREITTKMFLDVLKN
jgi:acetyl-CoA carboxylase/biotin carboxylase 1